MRFTRTVTAADAAREAQRLSASAVAIESLRGALLTSAGAAETGRVAPLQLARVKIPAGRSREQVMAELSASPLVAYCEPNYLRRLCAPLPGTPNDPLYQTPFNGGTEWWAEMIQADLVVKNAVLPAGAPVTIAILDTGIYLAHEDLAGRLVAGADFINVGGNGNDDHGHGTHVAGIAAAATNNGLGIVGTASAANIKLMPVKILDLNGAGDDYTIARGMVWAADHGARVLNLSLGGTQPGRAFEEAIAYVRGLGGVVVAAAGNQAQGDAYGNPPYNPVMYPAAYPQALAVAACTPAGGRALYSEYGNYVDLAAPGGGYGGNAEAMLSTWNTAPNAYAYEIGTSMATPVVAGAAAMLLAQDPARTPEQVETLLTTTAMKTGPDAYNGGWNPQMGWGCVNLYQALNRQATFTPKTSGRPSYNYPNPFAPGRGESTAVLVPLPAGQAATAATLRIFDALGRPVRTVSADASAVWSGSTLAWDGRNDRGQPVSNGTYPYRLEVGGKVYANKIVVQN